MQLGVLTIHGVKLQGTNKVMKINDTFNYIIK